ncbi:MAG: DnaB helicase C-terminal domain-containing protein [Candidatus Omnitrophica bacterium]|nr:DnaB helicase C-terminal domain-containing protein [Candidatus Omnitrophota bacterium]
MKKTNKLRQKNVLPIREIMDDALREMKCLQAKKESKGEVVYSGMPVLDKYIKGFYPGELTVVAGTKYCGKTSFLVRITLSVTQSGKKVLFFSPSLRRERLVHRFLGEAAMFSDDDFIFKPYSGPRFLTQLVQAAASVSELPIYIDDSEWLSINRLERRAIYLSEKDRLSLIIVDCLQEVDTDGVMDKEERDFQEYFVLRELYLLARKLHIPVIVAARVTKKNRSFYRSSMQPPWDELWVIEGYADTILYVDRTTLESGKSFANHTSLITIHKNRRGPIPREKLQFFLGKGIIKEGEEDEKAG